MCRYLFLCPDSTSASGGIAVIYDLAALLNSNGYNAAVVHNSKNAGYPDYPEAVPMFFTDALNQTYWRNSGRKYRVQTLLNNLRPKETKLQHLELRPDDVIVSPEFQFAEAVESFPNSKVVVFVQNPFSLMTSYHTCLKRGIKPRQHVRYWLGIAEVCRSHLAVLNFEPSAIFPVTMKPHDFPFQETKQNLITYMPRKRPWEAKVIADALQRRGNIYGYRLEALENITRAEVASKLGQSRFFISLLQQEALGFPAAEAMSSGCIVIGFDGLGTSEYFDAQVGIPVTEGDVAGLINAVEVAVEQYETEPRLLNEMRKRASERVRSRYSQEAFRHGALEAWAKMHKTINE